MRTLKIVLFTISFLLILTAFNSCATILSGRYQKIELDSYPTGADVIVNGKETQKKTPCTLKLKRRVKSSSSNNKNEYHYILRKDGYHDFDIRDKSEFNGVAWLNIFSVPAFPTFMLVDWASGSVFKYDGEIKANLNKADIIIKEQTVFKTDTIVKKEYVFIENGNEKHVYEFEKLSDVDQNIPQIKKTNKYRFALIIGNEDYKSFQNDLNTESNVDFARNDASAFKEYAINTLGIPERNITFLLDATSGQMNQALTKLNLLTKTTNGKAEIFFYYAGHGLPDEASKEPYLIPVDVAGNNPKAGILLRDVNKILTEHSSKRVTMFIDACFSGGARNQGLIAARAVKVRPKQEQIKGNLIIFSASSDIQSALPLKDQKHGIFTYYLLKKLQESKGDISYQELKEYITEQVGIESILINQKEQTPQVILSPSIIEEWKKWKLND